MFGPSRDLADVRVASGGSARMNSPRTVLQSREPVILSTAHYDGGLHC